MQLDMFSSRSAECFDLPNATIHFWPHWVEATQAETLLQHFSEQLKWRQDHISMFGKRMLIPRLQAWYGDKDYRYSGIQLSAQTMPEELAELRLRCEQQCQARFNVVLANFYRDQHDSMGWHSDDEVELGPNPTIASISLGCARVFELQHKQTKQTCRIELSPGSLLLMSGETQHHWRHRIAKQRHPCASRINLTFRYIK